MQAVTTMSDGDITAVLLCSFIVFFQNIGFAALENGNVRAKNARAILLKNCIDKLVGGICYWAVGFAFAYGSGSNGFIGTSHFFLSQLNGPVAALWVLSATFLMTATTIVSGCLAERAQFEAYLAYTPLMAGLVYPLVVHWVTQGWLTTFATHCTYLDFAGGSMVHLVGGVAGLVAAWLVGPRLGRFDGATVKPIPGHNVESTVLGTLMLWFGWYGFNVGPAYLRGDERGTVAARAAVNTTICGCAGALTALLLAWLRTRTYEVRTCCNGVLGGMVAITALAPFVDPWAAFVLGCIAGGVYIGCSRALLWLRIDDPLDASAVHAGCAIVGLLGVGVFGEPTYIAQNREGYDRVCGGFFFASPARRGGEQLGVQLLGTIVISAFTAVCSLALFGTLRLFNKLRVDTATEIAGLDFVDHGGSAYPDFLLRVEAQD